MAQTIPTTITLPKSGATVEFYDVVDGAGMGEKQWDYQIDLEKYILSDEDMSPQMANLRIRLLAYKHLIKTWTVKDNGGETVPLPNPDNNTASKYLGARDLRALWKGAHPLWQWFDPQFEPTTESEDLNSGAVDITASSEQPAT